MESKVKQITRFVVYLKKDFKIKIKHKMTQLKPRQY